MTGQGGLRIALGGASGALAREVLAVMEERRLPVSEILPFATEASLGQDIEFQDQVISLQSQLPSLRGVDLLLLCTPSAVSLDLIRQALRAEVLCIDCSGALAGSADVPLLAADLCAPGAVIGAPMISSAAGPALAWALTLAPLARAAGLERVVGTLLQSASHAGRSGIEVLSRETLALLNQQDPESVEFFSGPIAFDCVPAPGPACEGGNDVAEGPSRELNVARDVQRLVQACQTELTTELSTELDTQSPAALDLRVAVNAVQVPTFVSDGSALAIQTRDVLSAGEAGEILQKATGVKLWDGGEGGPSTRDASAQDVALVGRLRQDPSLDRGLLLWVTADPLRLSAVNAVKLAETRLRLN